MPTVEDTMCTTLSRSSTMWVPFMVGYCCRPPLIG